MPGQESPRTFSPAWRGSMMFYRRECNLSLIDRIRGKGVVWTKNKQVIAAILLIIFLIAALFLISRIKSPQMPAAMAYESPKLFVFEVTDSDDKPLDKVNVQIKWRMKNRIYRGIIQVKTRDDAYYVTYIQSPRLSTGTKQEQKIEPESFIFTIKKKGYKTSKIEFTLNELDDKYFQEILGEGWRKTRHLFRVYHLPSVVLEKAVNG